MKPTNQQGFAHIVALVLMAVVILGVGFFAMQTYQNTQKDAGTSKTSSSANRPADVAAVKSTVVGFYTRYNAALLTANRTKASHDFEWQHLADYSEIAPGLAVSFTVAKSFPSEPVVCTQNTLDSPFTVDKITIDGDDATAIVTQKWPSSTHTTGTKLAKVNGRWQINQIDCQPSQ